MNISELVQRLNSAHVKYSLRKIGAWCEVSHERLRTIMCNREPNISVAMFNKIDAALTKNGF